MEAYASYAITSFNLLDVLLPQICYSSILSWVYQEIIRCNDDFVCGVFLFGAEGKHP